MPARKCKPTWGYYMFWSLIWLLTMLLLHRYAFADEDIVLHETRTDQQHADDRVERERRGYAERLITEGEIRRKHDLKKLDLKLQAEYYKYLASLALTPKTYVSAHATSVHTSTVTNTNKQEK